MKNIKSILLFIVIGAFLAPITIHAQKKNKEKDEIEVRVDGLGCPFCAYGLEKKINELKGVKGLKIDMKKGILTFKYPSEKEITVEAIENQVEVAGYTAVYTNLTRSSGEFFTTKKEEVILEKGDMVNLEENSFMVYGKCKMCRARIEKTATKIEGVYEAEWVEKTQMLNVKVNSEITDMREIHKAIAKVGHDTERERADDMVYENLPACCLYKRKKQ